MDIFSIFLHLKVVAVSIIGAIAGFLFIRKNQKIKNLQTKVKTLETEKENLYADLEEAKTQIKTIKVVNQAKTEIQKEKQKSQTLTKQQNETIRKKITHMKDGDEIEIVI